MYGLVYSRIFYDIISFPANKSVQQVHSRTLPVRRSDPASVCVRIVVARSAHTHTAHTQHRVHRRPPARLSAHGLADKIFVCHLIWCATVCDKHCCDRVTAAAAAILQIHAFMNYCGFFSRPNQNERKRAQERERETEILCALPPRRHRHAERERGVRAPRSACTQADNRTRPSLVRTATRASTQTHTLTWSRIINL